MKVFLLTLVLALIGSSNGQFCNLCVNGRACVSEKQYATCTSSGGASPAIQPESVTTCPMDANCFRGSCIVGYPPSCKVCGVCSAPNGIACISEYTFQFCRDNEPQGDTLKCEIPWWYKCNPMGTQVDPCINDVDQETPVCPIDRDDPPVPRSEFKKYLADLCEGYRAVLEGASGNIMFPYDKTCSVYVKCDLQGEVYEGTLAACQAGSIFNPIVRYCLSKLVDKCLT